MTMPAREPFAIASPEQAWQSLKLYEQCIARSDELKAQGDFDGALSMLFLGTRFLNTVLTWDGLSAPVEHMLSEERFKISLPFGLGGGGDKDADFMGRIADWLQGKWLADLRTRFETVARNMGNAESYSVGFQTPWGLSISVTFRVT